MYLGSFSKVVEPEVFCDNSQAVLQEARNIIDDVDSKITGFLANFTLHASPKEAAPVPETAIEKLDGAPQDFLVAILKYVDFSEMSDEMREKNTITLAGFVARRFTAISLVAHAKKLNGETDPFHAKRHSEVLRTKAIEIKRLGGHALEGQRAFSDFMAAGCYFQRAYMTGDHPEAAAKVATRLQKLGINPL